MAKRRKLASEDKQQTWNTTVMRPSAQPRNLCKLSIYMIMDIFHNVPLWHHHRIRGTSRCMHDTYDAYLMQEFRKELHKNLMLDPRSNQSCALLVVNLATEVYAHSGYESIVSGCLLEMLRATYKTPFHPSVENIKLFLPHFYKLVGEAIGDPSAQRSGLLYCLTLMRFFKHFKSVSIYMQTTPNFRICVHMKGSWLDILSNSTTNITEDSELRTNLLVVFAQLLLGNRSRSTFKDVFENNGQIYIYGNDRSDNGKTPYTHITFEIHGPARIRNLFRSCFATDVENDWIWPTAWPCDQFTVSVDVECRGRAKWTCQKIQRLDIGPFNIVKEKKRIPSVESETEESEDE